MFVSRRVVFDEHQFPFKWGFSLQSPLGSIQQTHQQLHVSVLMAIALRSCKPVCEPTCKHVCEPASSSSSCEPACDPTQLEGLLRTSLNFHPMQTQSKSGIFKPKVFSSILTEKEPMSIKEAFKSAAWSEAAKKEYDALITNQTWELMPLLEGRRVVGCKWIFKIERNVDGSVAKDKGWLVVKGYLQEAGIDFQETFSPVVKPTTIRVVLTLAVSMGWCLEQVDITNVFLNGDLHEETYMVQPPGFEQGSNGEQLVCRLRKALYGLKQAARA